MGRDGGVRSEKGCQKRKTKLLASDLQKISTSSLPDGGMGLILNNVLYLT